jgi:hypothetical protein
MASNDDFEQSSGSSSSSSEAYKYSQLTVPSFALDTFTAVTPSTAKQSFDTSGTSFLRLGSFPTYTWDKSKGVTAGSGAPEGFEDSVLLAKLAGDASAIATAEPSGREDAAPAALPDSSGYTGDSNYLLGFNDDTRYRDPAGTTFLRGQIAAGTTTARKAETQTVLTKGGWWDHSGGNRVTTTAGDKIEVIQGNYKMVVLGRQDPESVDAANRTAITDNSGGHFQLQAPTPTPCIKSVEYRKDGATGIWALYQEGSGNVTTKFHGKQQDLFTGSRKESTIGSAPVGESYIITSDDPEILSKTWAQAIENYIGSDGKPVLHVYSFTGAAGIANFTFAVEVLNLTTTGLNLVFTTLTDFQIYPMIKWSYLLHEFEFFANSNKVTAAEQKAAIGKVEIALNKYKVEGTSTSIAAKDDEAALVCAIVSALEDKVSALDEKIALEKIELNGFRNSM